MKDKYMQGDFVIWNGWKGKEYVAEINALRPYYCDIKFSPNGFPYIEDNISMGNIKPIPLTMEILEKNGFTVGNYNEWTNPICDFIHFSIYNYKKKEWGVYARGTTEKVCLTTIKYVHEFQHLLWALGLNDKIKVLI